MTRYTVSESGCWNWSGLLVGKAPHEYGAFNIRVNGRKHKLRAHRVSYAFHNDTDPGSLFVCHKCDNPKCINPSHLFLGTPLDNTLDMISKGRDRMHNPLKGADNPRAMLTEPDIDLVLELLPKLNNTQIAARLNNRISHGQVSRIRLGKSWSHYTGIEPKTKAA